MKIKLIVFGKLANEFLTLAKKYETLIKTFAQLEIVELKETTHKNIDHEKELNTKKLLEVINVKENNFYFSFRGQPFSSEQLAKKIDLSQATFIIGPSNGLIEEEIKFPKISLSNATFPHQLFRIMACEQIYRALSINNNSNYHK